MYYCVVDDWECPYYNKGICHIEDPAQDCDDYAAAMDLWEDDEDDGSGTNE